MSQSQRVHPWLGREASGEKKNDTLMSIIRKVFVRDWIGVMVVGGNKNGEGMRNEERNESLIMEAFVMIRFVLLLRTETLTGDRLSNKIK